MILDLVDEVSEYRGAMQYCVGAIKSIEVWIQSE